MKTSPKQVELAEREQIHTGFLPMSGLTLRFERYDGAMSEWIARECYTPQYDAAGILLYDPKCQQVILVEQFRCGAFVKEHHPWVVEPVMGMIDHADESAQQVAVREALEEAGAQVYDVQPIFRYFNSPGTSSEYVHLFCGLVDSESIEGVHGLAVEHEDIKVVKIPVAEITELLQHDKVNNAAMIIALQWLLLNKEKLT